MGITIVMYKCMLKDSIIGLQNNGQDIKWNHLWSLYYRNRSPTGLAILPHLKFEHIHLNSFSKMRVDLAAQVSILHVHVCSRIGICVPSKCRFSVALYPKA